MLTQAEVTKALVRFTEGEREALDEVLPLLYEHLREMAQRELRRERGEHTLTPTALVHEAYLKLVRLERIDWQSRAHFLGMCARSMRRILIDYARAKKARKRGGPDDPIPLDGVVLAAEERPADLLDLDEALSRLEKLSGRQARVVECRFFAGMSVEETAEVLETSPATVKRDWTMARAFLNRALGA